jgi:uncharacterized protein YecT (DUF1311 family)
MRQCDFGTISCFDVPITREDRGQRGEATGVAAQAQVSSYPVMSSAKIGQAGGVMRRGKLFYETVGGLLLAMLACWAAAALILLSHPATAQSLQPSFDCSKATTRIESIICSDPELAEWDANLGRAYKQEYARLVGNDRQGLIKDQRQWISSRNAQCNQPELAETKACIIQFTQSRLAALAQQNGQPSEPSHFDATKAEAEFREAVSIGAVPLRNCVRYQATKLMVTNEPAEAVAAAAINLCSAELLHAAQVLDYQTDKREPCVEGSQRCNELEKMITADTLPGLAALVMRDRAEAAKSSPSGPVERNDQVWNKPSVPFALDPWADPTATHPAPWEDPNAIPLSVQGGTFVIPVLINDQITLNFTIDSGAADVSIPADVVSTLIRTGTIRKSDFMGQRTYRLADGSTVPSATFVIRSLKVGNHLLENVTASVASADADLLLGQSFLRRFNSWSIDNKRQVLLLD